MAKVSITINRQSYDIACEDGQEPHILTLAGVVDGKVGELVAAIGQAGEARLLAMAGLLVADDVAVAQSEIAALQSRLEAVPAQSATPPQAEKPAFDEDRLAAVLDALAARIETIAETVERA